MSTTLGNLLSCPKGRRPLDANRFLRRRMDLGSNVSYKVRLIAKGYAQKEGIDYNEIVSPVVKHSSIRIVLALVAQYDYELDQLDVKTAFLYGGLEEEIYMSQSLGFRAAGRQKLVCKLQKSLYELKQSLRQWYKRFDSL